MSELAITERDGGVAVLRISRPEKHNAVDRATGEALIAALDAIESDETAIVCVLTGSGDAFCAGADMTEAVARIDERGRSDGMAATCVRAARFSKPLIAAVNGPAYGGGALLAISCDFRVASERAAFRFPGAAYGLVVGGVQLPRVIGPAMAKELLFTTRVVQADEALRIGLVNRVLPPTELEPTVMELARQIAANSPEALVATKQVADRATAADDAQRMENEHNARLRGSPEHHARFRAAADRVARRGGDGQR